MSQPLPPYLPTGLSIRRAVAGDVAHVQALTRQAYAKWVPAIGREPLPMAADYDRAVREHIVDLLFVVSEPAGLIEMVNEGDHLLIENVAIAPAFQRRGYGGLLVAHADEVARSLRLGTLRLYTNARFAGNVDFYRRHGYTVDREEPFKGGITIHMSKKIDAA
ncbi:MAG TPA: GNAT family N-acetyltransferase [Dongiaceae bacterium]|jgi:GNAT superfamily N-acetyltransferase|nr:GNAT family N-acetyltransferase [Dongiaceae bacterium]